VLLFLNAHRWIALNVNDPVERAKDKEVRPFAFAPGRSRYAAIALSVKSIFIIPLVYLSSQSDPRIASGILCALTWYFFLASIAWAPYINYNTNRWVSAALAVVAWTCTCSFVFSCIPALAGSTEVDGGTWYGFVAWILGTAPIAFLGYRLSLRRQKHTLRLVIQSRLAPLFGSGQGQPVKPLADGMSMGFPASANALKIHKDAPIVVITDADMDAASVVTGSFVDDDDEPDKAGHESRGRTGFSCFAAIVRPCRRARLSEQNGGPRDDGLCARMSHGIMDVGRYFCFLPPWKVYASSFVPTTGPSRRTFLMLARRMADDTELLASGPVHRPATGEGSKSSSTQSMRKPSTRVVQAHLSTAGSQSSMTDSSSSQAGNESRTAGSTRASTRLIARQRDGSPCAIMDLRECLLGLDDGMWLQVHSCLSSMTGISALLLSSNSLSPFHAGFVLSSILANPHIFELHTLDLSNNSAAFGNDIALTVPLNSNKIGVMEPSIVVPSRHSGSVGFPSSVISESAGSDTGVMTIDPSDAASPETDDAHAVGLDPPFPLENALSPVSDMSSSMRHGTLKAGHSNPLDSSVVLDEAPLFSVIRHSMQKESKCKNASVLASILRRTPRLRTLVLDGCILRRSDVSQLVGAMMPDASAPNSLDTLSRSSRQDQRLRSTTDPMLPSLPYSLVLNNAGVVTDMTSPLRETHSSSEAAMRPNSVLSGDSLTRSLGVKIPSGLTVEASAELGTSRSGTLSGIHTLSLSGCYLSAQAIKPLARYLAHPQCTIRRLVLSRNMLGPDGAKILAPALRVNRSLREFDLTWNNLGISGCRQILDGLPYEANRVISVQLHCNKVDTTAFATLDDLLSRADGPGGDSRKTAVRKMTSSLHPWLLPSISERSTTASSAGSSTEDANRTLYDIVGGESMIQDVVDTFYLLLVTDPMIGPKFFHHITMSRMRHLQLNYICNLLGGPQEVENRDLFGGHKHLGINDDMFDQVLAHLGTAFVLHLSGMDMPAYALRQIHDLVQALRPKIVTRTVDGTVLWRQPKSIVTIQVRPASGI
jgi:truncated hemoglobin YjbI